MIHPHLSFLCTPPHTHTCAHKNICVHMWGCTPNELDEHIASTVKRADRHCSQPFTHTRTHTHTHTHMLTGALLGWLVFKDIFGPLVYGCLFGLIAGMMVFISLKELIPTAHKFDRRGILVAVFLVIGMVIMAASLLLFLYWLEAIFYDEILIFFCCISYLITNIILFWWKH